MADPLDDEIIARYRGGTTMALHERDGMPIAAHAAGMIVTFGTASHAFQILRPGSAGHMTFVKIHQLDVESGIGLEDETFTFISRLDLSDVPAAAAPAREGDVMARIAEKAAAARAAVPVDVPAVPQLGEDLVDNVRRLFNLTNADVAFLFGISERHVHRWKTSGVPTDRRNDLAALQAIGLTVVAGIGPAGARTWLRAGDPSGEDLVRAGRFDELAARAEAEKDSPFT
jgi:hypothetical protein